VPSTSAINGGSEACPALETKNLIDEGQVQCSFELLSSQESYFSDEDENNKS
jgi:hypothetical protein